MHGIVTQSGGHIKVNSQLGHSTTFKVYLPQAEESIQPVKQQQPSAKTARTGETILLVEDEDTVREVVNQILHKNGA